MPTPLATFARNFVRATPTVIGSPTSSRTRRRSRAPISAGVPAKRSIPRTSRNASSMERASTTGAVSSKMRNTSLLASVYASNRQGTTAASGHRKRARPPPIPLWTPRAFASYEAASTTPPPTMTGLPRNDGSSRCSTEA